MGWLLKGALIGLKYVAKAFLWVAAKPVVAAVVGVALFGAAALLDEQPWAGSDTIARMLGYAGWAFISGGIGAWAGRKVLGAIVGGIIGHAAAIKWLWWMYSPTSYNAFRWAL